MKHYMRTFISLLLLIPVIGQGEFSKKEIKSLKKMVSIKDIHVSDKTKNMELVTVVYNSSDKYYGSNYTPKIWIRILVELMDSDKNTYLVDKIRVYDAVFPGQWDLSIPHGEYKRLRVTAYAAQHGIKKDGVFVPHDEELHRVRTLEELTDRTTQVFPGSGISFERQKQRISFSHDIIIIDIPDLPSGL
jgi:hypothetical protein